MAAELHYSALPSCRDNKTNNMKDNSNNQYIFFGFIQSSTKLFYTMICLKTQYYCLERKKWKAFVTYFFFTITFDLVVNLMYSYRIF